MGFLLTIPPPSPTKPAITAPVELTPPPALPLVVAPTKAIAVKEPKAPRQPLAIRLDNALQPLWRLGVGVFFVSTAIPLAICAVGAGAAVFTGGNSAAWWNAMSLASPLGTIGIPSAMIMVRVAADLARARRR